MVFINLKPLQHTTLGYLPWGFRIPGETDVDSTGEEIMVSLIGFGNFVLSLLIE